MKLPCSFLLVAAAVMVFAGCGGGTEPELRSELTEEEARQLFAALTGIFDFNPTLSGASSTPTPSLATSMVPIDITVPCPDGGTVRITGTLNWADDFSSSSSSYTAAYSNCRFAGFMIGKSLQVDGEGEAVEGSFSMVQKIRGTISVITPNNKSADCTLDITERFFVNHQTGDFSITRSGTACGYSINST